MCISAACEEVCEAAAVQHKECAVVEVSTLPPSQLPCACTQGLSQSRCILVLLPVHQQACLTHILRTVCALS